MRTAQRLEPAAIAGVMSRELTMYRRQWRLTTVSSALEPTLYLLAFGFGFGALVSTVQGLDYLEYVATGVVATSVMFSSVFPGMFGGFIKRVFQRSYDAVLATPTDTEELVTGEALWLTLRAGGYGIVPLLVALFFGLDPTPGMLLVPFIGALTGFGFACLGLWFSGVVPSIDQFDYVISGVLTPLFLVAGTFFPIEGLPTWAEYAALANPLYHCVELVRAAVFATGSLADLGHVAALVVFGFITWRMAVRRLTARLVA